MENLLTLEKVKEITDNSKNTQVERLFRQIINSAEKGNKSLNFWTELTDEHADLSHLTDTLQQQGFKEVLSEYANIKEWKLIIKW